jgi:predicted DNA-binding antitoxin AbrB/MazE fold protein
LTETGGAIAIIEFMSLPKTKIPAEGMIEAVYENGVLRPLRSLALKEKSRVTISLCPEATWRRDFDRLLRRMRTHSKAISQRDVEMEITQARTEVKAKRRTSRRSA